MNEPPRETVESALQLGGWSGLAIDLMEWYLYDYVSGSYEDSDGMKDDWIAAKINAVNTCLQSRIFELKQLAAEVHQGNTTT